MIADGLHLLRPEAFWLLLIVIPASLLLWRATQRAGTWRTAIDPDLIEHVLADQNTSQRSHNHGFIVLIMIMAVAAIAGPSLSKVDLPVFQRADALVIVLDLSASMAATDTQPSRIRRARQKIRDLLAERSEGVTGMVAYAGDAHVVAPLTDDRRTIENLLPALDPGIMPLPGSNATAAIKTAADLLVSAGVASGQILLLTDDMPKFEPDDVISALNDANAVIGILGMGTRSGAPIPRADGGFIRDNAGDIVIPGLPISDLETIAADLDGRYATVALDDSDLRHVMMTPSLTDSGEIQLDRKTDAWLDQGNWLALLLALCALPLFRRGVMALLLLAPLLYSDPLTAQSLGSLWQTPDQQASTLLQQGNPQAAAELFEDSQWRGTAHFQAKNWLEAAESFGAAADASSLYNKANALAVAGDYEQALKAYDEALGLEPNADDALRNRDIVAQLLQQQKNQSSEQGDNGEQQSENPENSTADSENSDAQHQSDNESEDASSQDQDERNNNEQSESGSQGDGQPENTDGDNQEGQPGSEDTPQSSDAMSEAMEKALQSETEAQMSTFDEALEEQQALEQWLRRVPDDPGGLLRRKFRYETIQRLRQGEEPDEDIRW